MDLVYDRAIIIAEKDRISNLPKEIIHHILSFLDMKYAIQTSKLSRKWKHIWTSMPYLNLNSQTFRTLPQFANFVKHVLSHRNNQTEVTAAVLILTGKTTQFVVKSIINYAYSHNVRQLTMIWVTRKGIEFPQYLFSSQTLKHLTLATKEPNVPWIYPYGRLPESAWDFPALETLSLSNLHLGDSRDKSLNIFSKCVNLKDLTLHRVSLYDVDGFNVCAPQLSNLTITNPVAFPKVFNVVATQLKNLTASVNLSESRPLNRIVKYGGWQDISRSFDFLQLSTEGLDLLENVNLSFSRCGYKKERDVPRLLNLFQKLRSAKFLILDVNIIETLSSCREELLHKPCPFDNLKSLKIDASPLKQKELIATMPTQVKNYLLESSPSATFVMDLPQLPQKRKRQQDTMTKKVAKLEEKKQQAATMVEEKRMLEAKIQMLDEVISQQKVMRESVKLQHEKLMSQIIKCKMEELQVQVEGRNPDYELIHSMGRDIKSIIDLTPESLRVAMEAQFSCHYEQVKSLFLTHIDASQWAKIEIKLGCTRHSERTHSENIHSQSYVPVVALPPAP